MALDLSGGLDPEFEHFLAATPADPQMRDSASLWIIDQGGRIAFPRVTIDAIGEHWDRPWLQLNLALPDGRALRVWDRLPAHAPIGADGRASVLGAGPLRFACIEPFRRWEMAFEGEAEQSTTAAQMAGEAGGTPVPLAFHIAAEMAAPPWLMGGMTAEAARQMRAGEDGARMMGGLRYEQLCRVSGWARVGGEEWKIAGTGMRVRRQGVRNMGAAPGHCQHSALFPSGRAFGAIAFAPAADGAQSFNEAFLVLDGGRRVSARVVRAPWMTRLAAGGEDATLVLESEAGTVRIAGETLLTTFDHNLFEMADTSVLEQGTARYLWDGEETIGLIERCTLRERLGMPFRKVGRQPN
jgi:hypothetical protein